MTLVRFHRFRPAALLVVEGEDAAPFLQGQFSNDLRGAGPGATYGFWLSAKGKIEADSHVLNRGDGTYWILSHECPAEVVRQRLEAFIIADDVTVTDRTDEASAVWCWGEGAERVAAGLGLTGGGVAAIEGGAGFVFRGPPLGGGSFVGCFVGRDWPVPPGASGGEMEEVDRAALDHARHRARWPVVPREAKPGDLPQETGLDRSGVSLRKGCYVGQEVMARLDSMGQIRRALVLVRATGRLPAVPVPVRDGDRVVGELRSAVPEGDGFVGFAMVQGGVAKVQSGGVVLDGDGRALHSMEP